MVTEEQKRYFDVFGFLVLRQQFSSEEVKEITQALDTEFSKHETGRHLRASGDRWSSAS